MSNYSDFFGVGSSGGGGVPINSYLPLIVTATGNPTGYDAATGLYTHPNGEFYLQTGFTLLGAGSTYPDATSDVYTNVDNFAPGLANSVGAGTLGNNQLVYIDRTSPAGRTFNLDLTGGTTINFTGAPTPPGNPKGLAYDGTNFYVANGTNNIVYVYDSSFNYVTEHALPGLIGLTAIAYIDSNFWVGKRGGVSDHLTIWSDLSAAAPDYTYTMATNDQPQAIAYDGNSVYMADNITVRGYVNDPTTAPTTTGETINVSLITPFCADLFYDGTYMIGSNEQFTSWRYSAGIGDATARTDTDSTQPLFVRIK